MPKDISRILVAGPKGGIGKTTLSRNLAVAAAIEGLNVATLDLDLQRSLTHWYGKRQEEMAPITHYEATMAEDDVKEAIRAITDHDLLIIDTPPSIEDHPASFRRLAAVASLILVPTGQSPDDLDSVRPWMEYVVQMQRPAAFVLNRVKRQAKSFIEARNTLVATGATVCPVEIPDYEDMVLTAASGLGVLELRGAKGRDYVSGVWKFARGMGALRSAA